MALRRGAPVLARNPRTRLSDYTGEVVGVDSDRAVHVRFDDGATTVIAADTRAEECTDLTGAASAVAEILVTLRPEVRDDFAALEEAGADPLGRSGRRRLARVAKRHGAQGMDVWLILTAPSHVRDAVLARAREQAR